VLVDIYYPGHRHLNDQCVCVCIDVRFYKKKKREIRVGEKRKRKRLEYYKVVHWLLSGERTGENDEMNNRSTIPFF
jgi:hypothetical protein